MKIIHGYCPDNLIYTNTCFTYANLLFSFFVIMERVLITGGTGMLGTALTQRLVKEGFEVIILTRKKRPASNHTRYALWDAEKGFIEEEAIRDADHIVHLAGANLAEGRWTEKRKKIFR
ncbi:MAG: NAD-dependent epimerase/dehydratase family protein, partial [Flavisolibacter sp.]